MKRTLSLICCIILCLSLFACGKPEIKEITVPVPVFKPDAPDFNATGELKISYWGDNQYFGEKGEQGDQLWMGIEKFKRLYPNVTINLERVSYKVEFDEYKKLLLSDIKTSEGPDIFWTGGLDVGKMMSKGEFADMSEYFNNDPDFNIKDYNQVVFLSGQPKGKQYLIPLSYYFPVFMTTKTVLDKTGFDISKCDNYYGCCEEIGRILKENTGNVSGKDIEQKIFRNLNFPTSSPRYSGIDWLDLENHAAMLDSPELKKLFDIYKSNFNAYNNLDRYEVGFGNEVLEQFEKNEIMFAQCGDCFDEVINNYQGINLFDKASIFPLKNINGRISARVIDSIAVSNNSLNKQNAYLFAKTLLSDEVQNYSPKGMYQYHIPVSDVATKQLLEKKLQIDNSLDEQDDKITISKQSRDFIDKYMDIISQVDSVSYRNGADGILYDAMKPYFDDEKSYEECIKDAEVKLKKYLSE